MKMNDVVKGDESATVREQCGINLLRAKILDEGIDDRLEKKLLPLNKAYNEMLIRSQEIGTSTTKDFEEVIKPIYNVMRHPADFIGKLLGDLEVRDACEVMYVSLVAFRKHYDIFQDMPRPLQESIQMLGQIEIAKLNGDYTGDFKVAMVQKTDEDLEVTADGVRDGFTFAGIQICHDDCEFEFENPEDVVVFDPLEALPKKFTHVLHELLTETDSKCGHIHIGETKVFFGKIESKHARYNVFSLCDSSGMGVQISNGVIAMASYKDLHEVIPSFKFDETSQVMIHGYYGEIEYNEQRIEGERELLVHPIK